MTIKKYKIAVVIPSYKVKDHILNVINRIGDEVDQIIVVDDCCPEKTGDFVSLNCNDSRVVIVRNEVNLGVGGAVLAGYQYALDHCVDIIVKIDGDGQMDPSLIPFFINPIFSGEADYSKGNRFFDLSRINEMPAIRIFGNAVLSFMTKLSSGYWDLFDPTNGYTAIHADVARQLPFHKISKRYFFETDILFRLNIIRAVVTDVPMHSIYANEVSNLKINKVFFEFLFKHARNTIKRVFYGYYLRDFSVASMELPIGIFGVAFGIIYGSVYWLRSIRTGDYASAGEVMIAALPFLVGIQLILAFLNYDISSTPRRSIHGKFLPDPHLRKNLK